MKKQEIAWAAGIIDGESCIRICHTLAKPGGKPYYSLRIAVEMTHAGTVRRLASLFGAGSILLRVRGGNKPTYTWTVNGVAAEQVIRLIFPYVVTKKGEAMMALAFCELPKNAEVPEETQAAFNQLRHHYFKCLQQAKQVPEAKEPASL